MIRTKVSRINGPRSGANALVSLPGPSSPSRTSSRAIAQQTLIFSKLYRLHLFQPDYVSFTIDCDLAKKKVTLKPVQIVYC